ncbi:MAG: phycobilisome protein [Cyanobacteria bacterium P01_F01_bin.42]
MQLSDKVKALIAKSRIIDVSQWQGVLPAEAIALVQAADDQGRYLTDQDLEGLMRLAPSLPWLTVTKRLRDEAAAIVDESRANVLSQFPGLTEPGGGLYPAVRAEACWRDFWQFLRCITYGIAGARTQYTSDSGLGHMRELYQELQVPLAPMVMGLEEIKAASLSRVDAAQQPELAPYFDHLINRLRQFQEN